MDQDQDSDESAKPAHDIIQLIMVQPLALLNLFNGAIHFTDHSPQIWADICATGSEMRKMRVPLEIAKQYAEYAKRVPNSIHVLYPPGDNYAIVLDWRSWQACEYKHKQSIMRSKVDSANLTLKYLREDRMHAMSKAVERYTGARIATEWFLVQLLHGEDNLEHEVGTLSMLANRANPGSNLDLYIPPTDEELQHINQSQTITNDYSKHEQTETGQTPETGEAIQ